MIHRFLLFSNKKSKYIRRIVARPPESYTITFTVLPWLKAVRFGICLFSFEYAGDDGSDADDADALFERVGSDDGLYARII